MTESTCEGDTGSNEVTALLRDLIGINSVNPSLVPGAAGEAQIAAFVRAWAEREGLAVETVGADPERPNLIITGGQGTGGRNLILCAHLDTVGTDGMIDPLAPAVRGRRMHGRGSYDMKGGLAAALIACRNAHRRGVPGTVQVVAVADEEHSSTGIREVLPHLSADGAVVTEPTELQLAVAHRGFVWVEITIEGKAAHGSRPELGVDAIMKAGPVLVALDRLSGQIADRTPHPLLGTGVLHASVITGGREESTIPDRLTLTLERRTLPGETPDTVLAEIDNALDSCRHADPALVTARRVTLSRPPLDTHADADITTALAHAIGTRTSQNTTVVGMSYWADSAILAQAGIPTVLYGPAGDGAHAQTEWVDLDSVLTCAETLTHLAIEFTTPTRPTARRV
ncbi:M20/M25/M40 family metallo-hydrolase [Kribbella speibonae]|uniref:M20/M25/M40 family metallo-hydrolase n=1 Tax=Kribbella speibonae TaxID=1572660 RepID=A0A4R0IRH1_9ACTN|nr:M20/M25/M40 family metallo-hydrolase [Kribbella speibonae]TCC36383.1 M20/M25/M40 family metallo-hydrolase [Kribbella speibonae]